MMHRPISLNNTAKLQRSKRTK